MNKPYLKSNHSEFDYVHFPNKEPFLTSNARDYLKHPIVKREIVKETKELQKNSKIVLGDFNKQIISTYDELHNNPKNQKPRYDFNKVEFKYNQYNIHPITNEIIYKSDHNNWGFDYFNKKKPKGYVSYDKPMVSNTNFKKVYDPITNRFLN